MKQAEYNRMNEKEFRGRKARTLVPLRNGWGLIPPRTIVTLYRKWGGFTIGTLPCPCCGLRATIAKVPYQHLELLPVAFKDYDVLPGGPALCLVKVNAKVLDGLPIELVKDIEAAVGRPTLVVAKDFEVYLDTAAVEELARIRDIMKAVLVGEKA